MNTTRAPYRSALFGVVALTAFGAALAVHHREHPSGRRSFSRSSDERR